MHYRFFIADSGPFYDAMANAAAARKQHIQKSWDLAEKYGGKIAVSRSGFGTERLSGLIYSRGGAPKYMKVMDKTPDGEYVYEPDRRFKQGKELDQELRVFNSSWPQVQTAGLQALEANSVSVFTGRSMAHAAVGFVGGKAFARVPISDEGEEGHDWEPPNISGLREVKESEFLAAQGK